MSDFTFHCPHCLQSLEVPQEMLGQTTDCPNCFKQIQLPTSLEEPEANSAKKPLVVNKASKAPTQPAESPPKKLSQWALWAVLFAILVVPTGGFTFLPSIICGLIGIYRTRKGLSRGRRWAVASLVIACGMKMLLSTGLEYNSPSTSRPVNSNPISQTYGQQASASKSLKGSTIGGQSGSITVKITPEEKWALGSPYFALHCEVLENQGVDRYLKVDYKARLYTKRGGDLVAEYYLHSNLGQYTNPYDFKYIPLRLLSIAKEKTADVLSAGKVFAVISEYEGDDVVMEDLWIGDIPVVATIEGNSEPQ